MGSLWCSADRKTRRPVTGSLRERITTSTFCSAGVLNARSFFTSLNATPSPAGWSRRSSCNFWYGRGSASLNTAFSCSKSNRAREERATTSLSSRLAGMVLLHHRRLLRLADNNLRVLRQDETLPLKFL